MKERKPVMSVKELAEALGICLPTAYELIKRDGFPVVRVSKQRVVIPTEKFFEWLNDPKNQGWARV